MFGLAVLAAGCGGSVANDDAARRASDCATLCRPELFEAAAGAGDLRLLSGVSVFFDRRGERVLRHGPGRKTESLATTAAGRPGSLALSNEFAFWLAEEAGAPTLFRCPLPGGTADRLGTGVVSVGTLADRLVIGEPTRIVSAAWDGSSRTVLFEGINTLISLEARDDTVAWTSRAGGRTYGELHWGRPGVFMTAVDNVAEIPELVSLDSTSLLWLRPSGAEFAVMRRHEDEYVSGRIASLRARPVALAHDASVIVAAMPDGQLVSIRGGKVQGMLKEAVSVPSTPRALRLSGDHVVWVASDGAWRLPKSCACGDSL